MCFIHGRGGKSSSGRVSLIVSSMTRLVFLVILVAEPTVGFLTGSSIHSARYHSFASKSRPALHSTARQQDETITQDVSEGNGLSENQESEENADEKTHQINLQLADLARQCARRRSAPIAQQCLQILRQMEYPDTVGYNSVLKAFAKVSPAILGGRSAATQAEALLKEMKDLYRQQNQAKNEWYTALSEGTLSDEQVSQGPPRVRVKPNVRSFSTVMDAYARIGTREAADMVESILDELQTAYNETADEALRPTLITYNTVLAAYSKAGSTERCIQLLETMPMSPDIISCNAVLHSIARCGSSNAGARTEEMLQNLIQKHDLLPDKRSYTTCMDAWGQCGCPDKALDLLNEMKQLYEKTGDFKVRPNCVSYATVIHAYAISKDPDKATKAYELFQDMKQNGVQPNLITYNNLLNCCATSATQLELIELVEELYDEVLEHERPDQYTFGTVLKACGTLLRKDKAFAPTVFREACNRGQVSDGVLWQFRQAVPIDTYREMVGGNEHVSHAELPMEWSRHVRNERKRKPVQMSQ